MSSHLPDTGVFEVLMFKRVLTTILLIASLAIPPWVSAADRPLTAIVAQHLKESIQHGGINKTKYCRQEFLGASYVVLRFYEERDFRPAWIEEIGLSFQAEDLIRVIHAAHLEGLSHRDYHVATIDGLIRDMKSGTLRQDKPKLLADLDILLTDAFLMYASHVAMGLVDSETIITRKMIDPRNTDVLQYLHMALAAKSVESTLKSLRPSHQGYEGLRTALKRYRDIARRGGWQPIPPGPTMRRGTINNRIRLLRHHLVVTGDFAPQDWTDSDLFDDTLRRAVRQYQRRHGLAVDGVAGSDTVACLNVPVSEWIRKITVNLERFRWIPREAAWASIRVNIADYRLDVMENETSVLNMKVVVGSNYRQTPLFSGTMTYLVINPYWHVPTKLVEKDIYPIVRKKRNFLAGQKIRVFESWRGNAPEIDSATVDWSRLERGSFAYKLRQDPGPLNPLGRIKFVFPNKYAVYLHDTPHRELFAMNSRGFSAGCIRIEKPIDLAVYVLRELEEWTPAAIPQAIASGKRQVVHLPRKIPVNLLYWTAWSDRNGLIHFRNDIYERDDSLYAALCGKSSDRYPTFSSLPIK